MAENTLHRRSVLVTGGSRGIGRAIVERLLHEQYEVHCTYRSMNQELAHFATHHGQNLFLWQLDQGDVESIRSHAHLWSRPWWGVVFNAGLGSATVNNYIRPLQEDEAQDEALLRVNALGPLWLVERMVPTLRRQQQSKLIFISSVGGGITVFPQFKYADGMSKAALTFLAKQLSAELVHSGIDVFTICPGATDTAMFHSSTLQHMSPQERIEFEQSLPKKKLIQPTEIAHVVSFLLKPESTVLHGSVFDASMGLGSRPGILTERVQ